MATQTAEALSGSDWGLVYDLSCRALVGDQSRESYVAGLSAAGSPGQLAGGTLSAGSPTAAEGSRASELPAAAGEVRWVQMLQGEAIIGVARFVDDGDGFRYCGLSLYDALHDRGLRSNARHAKGRPACGGPALGTI